jgi:hypothetical protein
MPEFTAHYLFGEQALERFSPEIFSVINDTESNCAAFRWGLQGPDLLFYTKILRDRGWLARAGAAIHHTDPDTVFSAILSYTLARKDTPEYGTLRSYLYGFICHYALDSKTHPYVYHLAAKAGDRAITTRHIRIESEIGSILYNRLTGMPVSAFKIYDQYVSAGSFVAPICRLYADLIKRLFEKRITEKQVKSGFFYCLFLNRFTYLYARNELNSMLQSALLKGTRVVLRRFRFVNSFIKCDDVRRDTLNLMHNAWYNLNAPETIMTDSVPDLFESAVVESVKLAQTCSEMLEGGVVSPLGLTQSFVNGEPDKRREKPNREAGKTNKKTASAVH